jgi:hypothetical protein
MTSAELAWVACSSKEFGHHLGGERHLTKVVPHPYHYALTTMCGASASLPGIWRGSKTKPKCRTCEEIENQNETPAQPAARPSDAGEAPVECGHAVPQPEEVHTEGQVVADQGPLSERFPLDEWIEAVDNLVTQMGYEDWCEFRRMQEDETPALVEVWFIRDPATGNWWRGSPDGVGDDFGWVDNIHQATPYSKQQAEEHIDSEWVHFIEAPF